jgi:hypothetical protein
VPDNGASQRIDLGDDSPLGIEFGAVEGTVEIDRLVDPPHCTGYRSGDGPGARIPYQTKTPDTFVCSAARSAYPDFAR